MGKPPLGPARGFVIEKLAEAAHDPDNRRLSKSNAIANLRLRGDFEDLSVSVPVLDPDEK